MRLEPLYRARFHAPQSWSVELVGPRGTEGQNFLWTEGRCEGGIAATWRAANFPRRRTDDTLTPEFRGVLETDDGATILFAWHGYGRAPGGGPSQLVGSMNHVTDDERYSWLNSALCVVAGEVRRRHGSTGRPWAIDGLTMPLATTAATSMGNARRERRESRPLAETILGRRGRARGQKAPLAGLLESPLGHY